MESELEKLGNSLQQVVTIYTIDGGEWVQTMDLESVTELLEQFHNQDVYSLTFTLNDGVMWHFLTHNIAGIETEDAEKAHAADRARRQPAKGRKRAT